MCPDPAKASDRLDGRLQRITYIACKIRVEFSNWSSMRAISMYLENIAREWAAEPFQDLLRDVVDLLDSNPVAALKSLEELAGRGSSLSMVYLGDTFGNGRGVMRDTAAGDQWYRCAADAGSIEGAHRLAYRYFVQRRYDLALEQLSRLCARGFTPAMYCMGSFYHIGQGVDRDLGLAVTYWKMAAQGRHLLARHMLAHIAIRGELGFRARIQGVFELAGLAPAYILCSMANPKSERLRGWQIRR